MWSPQEAIERLGADTTYVQAGRRLYCPACRAAGYDTRVSVRASIEDFYDRLNREKLADYAEKYGQEAAVALERHWALGPMSSCAAGGPSSKSARGAKQVGDGDVKRGGSDASGPAGNRSAFE